MITEIISFEENILEKIKSCILNDELVAIPTETVYGLGANGLSQNACEKIFEAKNRPKDNPLILHISDYEMMGDLVYGLDNETRNFLDNFWPGPLTVVMRKKKIIPDIVSCGLDTVAIRMPESEITIKIINFCDVPLAAPSANISGKPSPTSAEDVFLDMNGKISLIIDGGECNIGIESTVLDITKRPFTILRPGFYTKEDFLKFESEINIDIALLNENEIPKSPGQKYKHYAPKAEVVVLVSDDREKVSEKINEIVEKNFQKKIGIFKFDETEFEGKAELVLSLGSYTKPQEMSKNLFKGLRKFDNFNIDLIIVEGCKEDGIGFSIMNRLKKSASGNVIYL